MPIGEYVSPDGQLKFLVTCPDGDWTIGFAGYPWHTHGSILAELSRLDEVTAVKRFLDNLTGNVSVIALRRVSGGLTYIWVTDDPAEEMLGYKNTESRMKQSNFGFGTELL